MNHTPRETVVDALVARFEEAAHQASLREVDLVIAGNTVRLRFAGAGFFASFVPALAHLIVEQRAPSPDLTLHLWDTQSTGVDMIAAPWDMRVLDHVGTMPEATAQGLYATYHIEKERLVVLDPDAGRGVLWMRDAALVQRHERAAPLRSLFDAFFQPRGVVVTHGGAVGVGGRGVLLGGRGGSGKSSTSLLCLEAGFDYAGDDYVLTEADGARGPMVHSLYNTGKVLPLDARHFTSIAPAFGNGDDDSERAADDKAIAYLHRQIPGRLSSGFLLVAILLPVVTGLPDTRLAPMSAALALRALAPSTAVQREGPSHLLLAALARLVKRVPSYRLELGTERSQIPGVIAGVIEGGGN